MDVSVFSCTCSTQTDSREVEGVGRESGFVSLSIMMLHTDKLTKGGRGWINGGKWMQEKNWCFSCLVHFYYFRCTECG